ncbi:MAG: nitronate monooxygenase [Actinomycetota bacterium]|nr:nitronate monooxygenase [Actinomycetota bacterium]
MAIRTSLTELFDLTYPIVLAPMAAVSGGGLASSVSNAGGLGLVGGGYGDKAWLDRELQIASESARGRWGAGLITWRATNEALEQVLSYHPDVVFLSFGDARPFVPSIKDAGCRLICQVQEVEDAREAKALGADVIVAQGTEAGGHGSVRATMPLVPVIVDAVAPTPVLAAGGIGDGRGLAAVLALGAAGAVIGTRFCAAEGSLMHPLAKQRLISSAGSETVRTHVFDEVRGIEWAKRYTGRALRNAFVDRWHDRDEGLYEDLAERERYLAAAEQGDFDTAMILAGEVVDMVERVEPASEILEGIGRDAEDWLRRAPSLVV